MLRIIPEPKNPKSKCTLYNDNHIPFSIRNLCCPGLYFEYQEDLALKIQFMCVPGMICVLKGDFVDSFSDQDIQTYLDLNLNWKDLGDYLDTVKMELVRTCDEDSPSIKDIWRFNYCRPLNSQQLFAFKEHKEVISTTTYFEFSFPESGVIIRTLPSVYGGSVRMDISDKDKNYWSALCLLKYLKQ